MEAGRHHRYALEVEETAGEERDDATTAREPGASARFCPRCGLVLVAATEPAHLGVCSGTT